MVAQVRQELIDWSCPMSTLATDSSQSTSTLTILIIDDKEADLQYWSGVIRNFPAQYKVLNARTCKSGVAMCRNETVDCVLLDLDMPESGFLSLFELIPNPKRPSIPVVILSRLSHPYLAEVTRQNGAQGWLLKDRTSADELQCAIQQAMTTVNPERGSREHSIQIMSNNGRP